MHRTMPSYSYVISYLTPMSTDYVQIFVVVRSLISRTYFTNRNFFGFLKPSFIRL